MAKRKITEALVLVGDGIVKGMNTMLVRFRGFARDENRERRIVRIEVMDKAKDEEKKSFKEYFLRVTEYGFHFNHDSATDTHANIGNRHSSNGFDEFYDASKRDRIEEIERRRDEIAEEERKLERELKSYRFTTDCESLELDRVMLDPNERDAEVRKIGVERVQAKRAKLNANRRKRHAVADKKQEKVDTAKAEIKGITKMNCQKMTDAGFEAAWEELLSLRRSRKKSDIKTLRGVLPHGLTRLPEDEDFGFGLERAIKNLTKPEKFFKKMKSWMPLV